MQLLSRNSCRPDGAARERLLAILDFWHKIEFFIPYDLSSRVITGEGRSVFWLHARTLEDDGAALRRPAIPEEKQITGFTLFLGVFSKSEVTDIRRRFDSVAADITAYEDAERGDLDGDTCFASLQLTPLGQPIFETFSVSTLPWALGRVQKSGLSSLSYEAFADSKRQLSELLQNFRAQRHLRSPSSGDTDDQPIDAGEILTLHELLCDWAGFASSREMPIAAVEIRYKDRVERPEVLSLPPQQESHAPDAEDEEDEGASVEEEIGILNSFFIEDIERAMISVRHGDIPEPLRQYLTPLAPEKRIDLYSQDGRRAIVRALHPGNINRGRWLSEPHHAMSLMQQFAINSAIGELSETGLFSVNGPPGTGKTTLLRDLFADNIVRRARVLSSLKTARDAFDGPARRAIFADRSTATISALIPALTGFEMVVASSNNAAVENISRDLPKRSSIARASSFHYLQTVAHKVACQKDNGAAVKLSDGDRPWGLIACALGNSRNRRAFKERFAFMEITERPNPGWSGAARPQTIWEWLKGYEGPSFAEASSAFDDADALVRDKIGQYARYADLYDDIARVSEDTFCSETLKGVAETAAELRGVQDRCDMAAAEMLRLREGLSGLKEEEQLLDRGAPAWWERALPSNSARQHRQDVGANARRQLELRKALAECEDHLAKIHEPQLEQSLRKHERAERALRSRRKIWCRKRREFDRLGEVFNHPAMPGRLADLETDQFQIDGLWHQNELAGLRSALLEAALTLHEAWLAEVGRKGGGFGGNIVAISKLLSNNSPVDGEHIASIWQGLFMIVPIVSTTFASFARQRAGRRFDRLGLHRRSRPGGAASGGRRPAAGAPRHGNRRSPADRTGLYPSERADHRRFSSLSPYSDRTIFTEPGFGADAGRRRQPLWNDSPRRGSGRALDRLPSPGAPALHRSDVRPCQPDHVSEQDGIRAGEAPPGRRRTAVLWRQCLDRRQGEGVGQTDGCRTDGLHHRRPHCHVSPRWRIAGSLYHLSVQRGQEQPEAGSGPCSMGGPERKYAIPSIKTVAMAAGTDRDGAYFPGQRGRHRFHGSRRRCRS